MVIVYMIGVNLSRHSHIRASCSRHLRKKDHRMCQQTFLQNVLVLLSSICAFIDVQQHFQTASLVKKSTTENVRGTTFARSFEVCRLAFTPSTQVPFRSQTCSCTRFCSQMLTYGESSGSRATSHYLPSRHAQLATNRANSASQL